MRSTLNFFVTCCLFVFIMATADKWVGAIQNTLPFLRSIFGESDVLNAIFVEVAFGIILGVTHTFTIGDDEAAVKSRKQQVTMFKWISVFCGGSAILFIMRDLGLVH